MMTRQFVLIDHSIEDSAGHYLEYARRVLRAAKDQGFRTVLAVNKRAQDLECPEADLILKSFSSTFWENQTQSKLRTLGGFILKNQTLAFEVGRVEKFETELSYLIQKNTISENDIVFIPTLGGTELLGISAYSKKNVAIKINWHLLFRRDVPPTDSIFNIFNLITKWRAISAFKLANEGFVRGSRYFYTDTEELSKNYDVLGVGKFKTLPIPLDDQLGLKRFWQKNPIVVSYLGDMRREKGFQLLPGIIRSLRKDGFAATQVIFKIQGNIPNGMDSRLVLRTRTALTQDDLKGVSIVEGPLNSSTYREIMISSDVILIPYQIKKYTARSSGIFAEALAAGIPTIHPQRTWMGQSTIGLLRPGYEKQSEITTKLKETLGNYKQYEVASLEFSETWRQKHSSKRVVQMIIENKVIQ